MGQRTQIHRGGNVVVQLTPRALRRIISIAEFSVQYMHLSLSQRTEANCF